MVRIALIHGLKHSPPPIEAAFKRLWPGAKLHNILDDSLASDLVDLNAANLNESFHESIHQRFLTLGRYAASTNADGILFTCSAFGPYIESVQKDLSIPVLKPNEAIIHDIIAKLQSFQIISSPIALVATFSPTLDSMNEEIKTITQSENLNLNIVPIHVVGALDALNRGDVISHDQLILHEVERVLAKRIDINIIALAQFSMERTQPLIKERFPDRFVLTTPTSAVQALQKRLEHLN